MLRVKRRARYLNGQQKNGKSLKKVSSILTDCKDMAERIEQKLCWTELGQELATKFSASIVSLASYDGDYTILFPVFFPQNHQLTITETVILCRRQAAL